MKRGYAWLDPGIADRVARVAGVRATQRRSRGSGDQAALRQRAGPLQLAGISAGDRRVRSGLSAAARSGLPLQPRAGAPARGAPRARALFLSDLFALERRPAQSPGSPRRSVSRGRPTRCRRLSKSRPRIRPRRVSGADANQLRSLRVQHSDVHVLLPMRHVQHDDPGLPGNDRRPERVFVRNVHRELQRRRRNRDLHERHVQLMLLVSPVRFELTTNGLKGRCSTG